MKNNCGRVPGEMKNNSKYILFFVEGTRIHMLIYIWSFLPKVVSLARRIPQDSSILCLIRLYVWILPPDPPNPLKKLYRQPSYARSRYPVARSKFPKTNSRGNTPHSISQTPKSAQRKSSLVYWWIQAHIQARIKGLKDTGLCLQNNN